jgi:hypothetical protein
VKLKERKTVLAAFFGTLKNYSGTRWRSLVTPLFSELVEIPNFGVSHGRLF